MCANLDPSRISPSSLHDKGQIGSKESATFTIFALLATPQIVRGPLYRFHDYFSVLHIDQHDIVLKQCDTFLSPCRSLPFNIHHCLFATLAASNSQCDVNQEERRVGLVTIA